jgi:hypothetical protein
VDELAKFKAMVSVCEEQAVMAAMFHATWSPTVDDEELSARMGTSFARHTFHIVGWALRRELILALMRIWDGQKDTPNMKRIRQWLNDEAKYELLLKERAGRISSEPNSIMHLLRESLDPARQRISASIAQYMDGGEKVDAIQRLRIVRNKRLAHRDLETPMDAVDPTDDQVVQLYLDTLDLVTDLLHLVMGTAFDLREAADVYAHHAKYFWVAARGERTEGHPNYRPSLLEFAGDDGGQ